MLAVKRLPGGIGNDSGFVSNQSKEILDRGISVMSSSENMLLEVEAFWFYSRRKVNG